MPIDNSNATLTEIPFRDKTAVYLRRVFRWTGPSSYPTGGETVNLTNTFGIGRVVAVLAQPATNGTDLRLVVWDRANSKMKWFDLAGAEIGNGTDLSTYSFLAEAIGR
jgi:hypothetical protein